MFTKQTANARNRRQSLHNRPCAKINEMDDERVLQFGNCCLAVFAIHTVCTFSISPVAVLEERPEARPGLVAESGDVVPAEGLVGVELSSDGGGEEGALVLEAVPGAAALLERQAVAAPRYLGEIFSKRK